MCQRTILTVMGLRPAPEPADLDIVRDSYDRVADNYVEMVTTTGIGDIRTHRWLKAAMDAVDVTRRRGAFVNICSAIPLGRLGRPAEVSSLGAGEQAG